MEKTAVRELEPAPESGTTLFVASCFGRKIPFGYCCFGFARFRPYGGVVKRVAGWREWVHALALRKGVST